MQKKLIALAVAAAFAAPALAETGNVTVYGKVYMTVDQFDDGVAGHGSVTRINTNASRLGFKGNEDLGDGLKAIFQYEVAVDADGQQGNGFARGTRNSGAGLEGDFGKVIAGRWDSPYKVVHNKIELFDNESAFTSLNVTGHSGGKFYSSRLSNMVQYWTPKISGLQAAVLYSPDEVRDNVTAPTGTEGNKYIVSTSLTYAVDALYVSGAYERRNDQTSVGDADNAFRLAGRYDLGDLWLGAQVESIKTNFSSTDSNTGFNWEVVGEYKVDDKNRVAASYANAGSSHATGKAKNDVSQYVLKLAHAASKRTELFAAYALKDINETNQKGNALGVGLIHVF
ncbi:porin [Ferrigenium sp. UT5]|uniref:porin n=1 Tax=Ferrigenium sp. UT5 TaxID=3242105 RepID=UPI00354DC3DD